MTRQITFTKFECGVSEFKQAEDGRYDLINTPVCIVEDSSCTKTDARKAIIAAGHECPRGTDIYVRKVGKVRYTFEDADLKAILKDRVELGLDGQPLAQ